MSLPLDIASIIESLECNGFGGSFYRWLIDPQLLGRYFSGPSWSAWHVRAKALDAIPLSATELAVFQRCTGRTVAPTRPPRRLFDTVARRSGKTMMLGAKVVHTAAQPWSAQLGPGEEAVCLLLSADQRQATIALNYCRQMLRDTPLLAPLIAGETRSAIRLTTGARIEVRPAHYASVRGFACPIVALDEICFWQAESINTPEEIVRAALPTLGTIPTSQLVGSSSPYRKDSLLYREEQRHWGKNDSDTLYWKADVFTMNPTISKTLVEEALAEDPDGASSEWMASWRSGISAFIDRDVVHACVIPHRQSLPPADGITYRATFDPAGGSGGGDSLTVCVYHVEHADPDPQEASNVSDALDPDGYHAKRLYDLAEDNLCFKPEPRRTAAGVRVIIDALYEARPPFNPLDTIKTVADLLKSYGVRSVTSDRWGGQFVAQPLRDHGIGFVIAEKPKSDYYRDSLAVFTSGRVELPDNVRLIQQLCGLERRTARSGKDSVDHGPSGRDDLSNVVCMAAALGAERVPRCTQPIRLVGL